MQLTREQAEEQQKKIDEELKNTRNQLRALKDLEEELERRFNRLGVDYELPIYPYGPLY